MYRVPYFYIRKRKQDILPIELILHKQTLEGYLKKKKVVDGVGDGGHDGRWGKGRVESYPFDLLAV